LALGQSGVKGLGPNTMDAIADLELGGAEQLVVGLAGQELGQLP